MTKAKSEEDAQTSCTKIVDLRSKTEGHSMHSSTVVHGFLDASTRDLRKNAIRRLIASGVFTYPSKRR